MRATRLVELADGEGSVTAVIERDDTQRRVSASWAVGCDGFHSTVRGIAGIPFEGTDIEAPWAVFDAALSGWNAELDVASAHLEERPVIMTPLPGGRWRVYLRPRSETSDLLADAREVIGGYAPGVDFIDVENPARFHCHSRVASRFREGRILLAGDAAHACSPAEGHGMNSGIQDAFNLGWKLALMCNGEGSETLLASYEAERRPVALRVVESGQATEEGQALIEAAARAARDEEITRTYADGGSAHREAVAAAEIDRSYEDSPIVSGSPAGALEPGLLLPDTETPVTIAGNELPLHQLAHRAGHTVLVLGGPLADAPDVVAVLREVERQVAGSDLVEAVFAFAVEPQNGAVGRLPLPTAEQLELGGVSVLAIRPDRYVGFRADGNAPDGLADYLTTICP